MLLFPLRGHVPVGYLNSLDILRLMVYCIASTEETISRRMRSIQFILFRQVDLIDSSEGGRRGNYFTYILNSGFTTEYCKIRHIIVLLLCF